MVDACEGKKNRRQLSARDADTKTLRPSRPARLLTPTRLHQQNLDLHLCCTLVSERFVPRRDAMGSVARDDAFVRPPLAPTRSGPAQPTDNISQRHSVGLHTLPLNGLGSICKVDSCRLGTTLACSPSGARDPAGF